LERTNPKHNDVLDHFAQAYVTVERLDVGKFYSWCGYESPESRLSDCYSRGLLYTLAEPVWHFGLRYAWNLNPGWNGSFYLVPAWNQSESPTESVGAAAQIHRKFGSATDVTIGYMRSEEGDSSPNAFGGYGGIGFPKPGSSRVGMFDLIATHVASKSLRLVFNADYGMASEGANSGVWLGAAAYAIYTTADKWQIVGRAESFADRSGNRVGVPASLFEVTLTVSHNSDGIIKRLEIRHDRANHGLFAGEDHQTTVSLSLGVTWQALR
jgi:hypothetical protein